MNGQAGVAPDLKLVDELGVELGGNVVAHAVIAISGEEHVLNRGIKFVKPKTLERLCLSTDRRAERESSDQ